MNKKIFEGLGVCYLQGLGIDYDSETYKTDDGGITLFFAGKAITIFDKRWYVRATLDDINERKSGYEDFTKYFNTVCRYEIVADTEEIEKNPKNYPFFINLYSVCNDEGILFPEYKQSDFRDLLYFCCNYSNQYNKTIKFLNNYILLFSETRRFKTLVNNFSIVFEYYGEWSDDD